MKRKYPTIERVEALEKIRLRVDFGPDGLGEIDLAPLATEAKGPLARLADRQIFACAQVGEHGASVDWPGIVEIGGDTLWRLAEEQAGKAMSATDFEAWMNRLGLSLSAAATELGVTRRAVAYYKSGGRLIPRVVMLACRALELDRRQGGRAA
jgi:hypothetical protein